ncbi:natterin-4-like [Elgaria multicarinata webbii]|uniref:natterin-4-like n=1 Tax=Elgaria multicarinata webbii TaxID=159646 RepID=UPI002FCD4E5E
MHLVFCALFMPLIAAEQCTNGVKVSLTVLNRTVEKSPVGIQVPGKEGSLKRKKRQTDRHSEVFDDTSLQWIEFQGSIPDGAVSFWNNHAKRNEYPCSTQGCQAGFYNPDLGSFCFYPLAGKQDKTPRFWLLVNENNLELLKWHSEPLDDFPSNSIDTCPGEGFYVAKNKYGIGAVVRQNNSFLIGIDGTEYSYKSYEVLIINKDYKSQKISHVHYFTEQGTYKNKAVILKIIKAFNHNCDVVKKKVSLTKEVALENHWDFNKSLSLGVSFTLSAGVPRILAGSWCISGEATLGWSDGFSKTETDKYSIEVETEVQPNFECEVQMEGIKMSAEIPFSASVVRSYKNGARRSATVYGVSRNSVVEQINAIIKRCQPIPDAIPCN